MDFEELYLILPKDPIKWTIDDVGEWLKFINLSQFIEIFSILKIIVFN